MKINKKGNIIYYTFESFDKTGMVRHCFSTRIGGVSQGCFESMNLSFRDDKRENVLENYQLICEAIGCKLENVVFSNQIHSDRIYRVSADDMGKGLLRESDIIGFDALACNEAGIVLTTFYADCTPLYFLDVKNKAIVLAHSGWRSTVKQIGAAAVDFMRREFKSEPENIIAGIGPCIGDCCFQVDAPVVEEFKHSLDFAVKYIKNDNVKGKYLIDLAGINREILINAGILTENIETADICTKCNPQLFFSHRNMGAQRGSMAALLSLK